MSYQDRFTITLATFYGAYSVYIPVALLFAYLGKAEIKFLYIGILP